MHGGVAVIDPEERRQGVRYRILVAIGPKRSSYRAASPPSSDRFIISFRRSSAADRPSRVSFVLILSTVFSYLPIPRPDACIFFSTMHNAQ